MQQKGEADVTSEKIEFNDIRKKGLMGNVDKKRTILTALKRNAIKGKPQITPIYNDDLRFKTWNDVTKPESKAVILAMMDTSASMGSMEKYLARSFFFWMMKFLRSKYESVEIAFIAHHTEAKVVSEEAFLQKGKAAEPSAHLLMKKHLSSLLMNIILPDITFTLFIFPMAKTSHQTIRNASAL